MVGTLPGVALGDKLRKVNIPPHLRSGNARKRCGNCRFFGRGECMKYGYPVRATQLCDSWAAARGKEQGE